MRGDTRGKRNWSATRLLEMGATRLKSRMERNAAKRMIEFKLGRNELGWKGRESHAAQRVRQALASQSAGQTTTKQQRTTL
eukprot:2624517-Pyramimonas_sp.AAC.1